MINKLRDFHEAYDIPPGHINDRLNVVAEELHELLEEIRRADLNEEALAKEAIDVVYTIVSLFVSQGWSFPEAFMAVHRSNMDKLHVIDGVPTVVKRQGKVVKPPHYRKPNLLPYLG